MIADILKVKETQMRNILKFGLMSAVAAVALAQTPAAQGMDEDVLAIATQGALSDSMQGFRKLADDEAGSIWGGLNYDLPRVHQWADFDQYGFMSYYEAIYPLNVTRSELNGGRLNIGAGESASDFNAFANLFMASGGLYIGLNVDFKTNRTMQMLLDGNFRPVANTAFTNRLLNFIRTYYVIRFGNDRAQYSSSLYR